MQKVTFEEKRVRAVEEEYKKIPLTEEVKERVSHMAKLFEQALPNLSFMALKGTILFSLQEWQTKTRQFSDNIDSLPPREKIQAIGQINNIVKERIKKLLRNKEDEKVIDQIFLRALDEAKKMFGV
ncbi:MAG: hypothetical protein EAX96_06955 [Candidatus Lokiarchaeota archaeon]|nr:hypothetical protein [Candidatus Lokiarchaeota archaeon]